MHKQDEVHWREVQLDPQQWANIPQSAGLWPRDRLDDAAEARLRLAEELTLTIHAVLFAARAENSPVRPQPSSAPPSGQPSIGGAAEDWTALAPQSDGLFVRTSARNPRP